MSDTHSEHWKIEEIPYGDVLLHAGDCTKHGTFEELTDFNLFLSSLPHPTKIVVAGNHDFCFQEAREESERILSSAIYLEDSAITIDGVTFYGSPWQPWFHDWAFNLQRGEELREKWNLIPPSCDVLITHTPPYGILDGTHHGLLVGCEELATRVEELKPKLHLFGHIHEAYGVVKGEGTVYANISTCTLRYRPSNPLFVTEL